jgi:hypothetical protein
MSARRIPGLRTAAVTLLGAGAMLALPGIAHASSGSPVPPRGTIYCCNSSDFGAGGGLLGALGIDQNCAAAGPGATCRSNQVTAECLADVGGINVGLECHQVGLQ